MEDRKCMISVQNVTMTFRKEEDFSGSLKETVTKLFSGRMKFSKFTALRDLSFNVYQGETVCLIGRNGAGKSTTLKIISGIMKPTSGTVVRNGNIVPMLELGSGFDYDLSGKENIFLNGAILGYEKQFLMDKYQEIVDYSGLQDFIDVPLRNYSSGMIIRLAFSIASVVEPEILIVDEILAVGDEAFQKKSLARMMELMTGGTTVLFVSHDMASIRKMCSRVIWLDGGTIRMEGDPDEVCDAYRI